MNFTASIATSVLVGLSLFVAAPMSNAADLAADLSARVDLDPKTTSKDALEVWTAIDKYWGRSGCCERPDIVADHSYVEMLSDDVLAWGFGAAGPESKKAIIMWTEKTEQMRGSSPPFHGTRLMYQLFPQGLVIHGNVAVAHYRYSVLMLDVDNSNKANSGTGRFSDVLVRERPGAAWKFLSWVGGGTKD